MLRGFVDGKQLAATSKQQPTQHIQRAFHPIRRRIRSHASAQPGEKSPQLPEQQGRLACSKRRNYPLSLAWRAHDRVLIHTKHTQSTHTKNTNKVHTNRTHKPHRVLGTGNLGRACADMFGMMGCRVLVHDKKRDKAGRKPFEQILASSDYILPTHAKPSLC